MATVFQRLKKGSWSNWRLKRRRQPQKVSFADELNADSLDLMEFITAIEEQFSYPSRRLEIADEEAEKTATVQDAFNYLWAHGGKGRIVSRVGNAKDKWIYVSDYVSPLDVRGSLLGEAIIIAIGVRVRP